MALWLNRQELSADARYAGERTNALNFMLWLGGSDKTMKDVVREVQRQTAAEVQNQIDAGSAIEGMDLGTTDWSTFSQGLNPGIAAGAGSGKNHGRKPSKR
jgi:antirestriction protein ArdC